MTTLLDIARGLESKLQSARAIGFRSNVPNADYEDLASSAEAAGGTSEIGFPDVAEVVSIVSDNAVDTDGSTGARSVRLYGLGEDWLHQEEAVALNGLSPVVSAKKFNRINLSEVETAGTVKKNFGRLLISQSSNGVVDAILAGAGRSFPGRYSVPADRYAYLVSAFAECSALGTVKLYERRLGIVRELLPLSSLDATVRLAMPLKFSPKTDLWLRAKAASGTAQITAGLELLLETI